MKAFGSVSLVLLMALAGCSMQRSEENPTGTEDWSGGYSGTFIDPDSPCASYFNIPVKPVATPLDEPAILDAWTTSTPYSDPWLEIYGFEQGVDTLAFVTKYYHTGGQIPEQISNAFNCGGEYLRKVCIYPWTMKLPPGEYLLINWYEPERVFPSGDYDWATRVGAVVFGYPNPQNKRPLCFDIVE